MGKEGLWTRLMLANESKQIAAINRAVQQYFALLSEIAADIYDSCIRDFYSQYTPLVYKRHGQLSGFNLYRANQVSFDGESLRLLIDESYLLPYGKNDNRDIVLDFVLAGLRGGPLPKRPDWPMDWYTTYPNSYSKYRSIWQSSGVILEDILDDFISNVVDDTYSIFIDFVEKNI